MKPKASSLVTHSPGVGGGNGDYGALQACGGSDRPCDDGAILSRDQLTPPPVMAVPLINTASWLKGCSF